MTPVDTSVAARGPYAYDASSYRVVPTGVAFPADAAEVVALLREAHGAGRPVTVRGGGTSMAGNAIGPGLVLDCSRHLNRVLDLDLGARTVTVEPGIVLDDLQLHLRPHGLMFAPDPSSHSRATIGGMIGNDACGNHSVKYGRTSAHVVALEVALADGTRLVLERGGVRAAEPTDPTAVARADAVEAGLRDLVGSHLGEIRTGLGQFSRQVSGYELQHLLPEHGFDTARAVVGSEGTVAVVLAATLSLVPLPPTALLVAVGYPSLVDAARDVPLILEFAPAAVEGMEESIVAAMRTRRGPDSVTGLPDGASWLYVDLEGPDRERLADEARTLAEKLRAAGRAVDVRVVTDPGQRAALWRVREDGAGLVTRPPSGGQTWAGWEDSAVPPERLADYLTDLRQLLDEHRLSGVFYGHLGAGCVHVRIDFDLEHDGGGASLAAFTREATRLVVRHGGSASGEHGDGRARSELLTLQYDAPLIAAFAAFKAVFDPAGVLNPGVLVDPVPLDADLAPLAAGSAPPTFLAWPHDRDLAQAAGRCVGVGRCRSDAGGVMCPSFRATHREQDSTRGRARALQEMLRGTLDTAGWRSTAVRDALDLCLACKACSSDCPVGVDMATYKAEFLHQHHKGRLRPRSHYSMGWLPVLARVAALAPALVNRALRHPWVRRAAAWAGGLTPARVLPPFHRTGDWRRGITVPESGPRVLVLVDTFTRAFRPTLAGAAMRTLSAGGLRPEPVDGLCCGLTWVSTGQLGRARRVLTRTVAALARTGDDPIVVLEPSCASALRTDAVHLLDSDEARSVAARVTGFPEIVEQRLDAGWRPVMDTAAATLQVHCHEYAGPGSGAQRSVLKRLGVSVRQAEGCCGLAGNFGFEHDHYETSMRVADLALVPALADTPAGDPVLADGFSCQTQIAHLDPDRKALHLAELLDRSLAHPDQETT